MPIRITGLNSGLDTESIISALVSSYSYKTSKYKKAQSKLSWRSEVRRVGKECRSRRSPYH